MTPNQKKWAERRKLVYKLHRKHMTLQEIGNVLGITRERVRQILDKFYNIRRRELSTHSDK